MTEQAPSTAPPRLELKGITKRFPGVVANDQVSFAVAPGEIHALLGENGAGKSTLVKIIYGVLHADEGTVLWQGEPVRIADPHAARGLGIGMVFQHFSLFEAMTVLENIALGVDDATDMRALASRILEVSNAYGLPLDPAREVHTLSVGERQRIEIVRCLLQSPKLLIMDEPTSVLTPQEVLRLFETLRQLAAEGVSILYISHKLEEIKALCDAATILRGGKVVATCDPKAETAKSMAQLMIGTAVRTLSRRTAERRGAARLTVRNLEMPAAGPFGTTLKDVSFEVRRGEIFGIAGVAGNGQNELFQAISGERPGERRHGPDRRARGRAPRRRRAAPARPVLRARGAQRPWRCARHVAGREYGAERPPSHGPRGQGLHPPPGRGELRRADHPRVRRPDAERGRRRTFAFRRQLAKVHRRPRGPAGPGRPDGVAADLGGRRRRRGRDPSGAVRPRRSRRCGPGGLAGPGRIAHAHRSPRGDQRRRAVGQRSPPPAPRSTRSGC